jgi:hypothetical protein
MAGVAVGDHDAHRAVGLGDDLPVVEVGAALGEALEPAVAQLQRPVVGLRRHELDDQRLALGEPPPAEGVHDVGVRHGGDDVVGRLPHERVGGGASLRAPQPVELRVPAERLRGVRHSRRHAGRGGERDDGRPVVVARAVGALDGPGPALLAGPIVEVLADDDSCRVRVLELVGERAVGADEFVEVDRRHDAARTGCTGVAVDGDADVAGIAARAGDAVGDARLHDGHVVVDVGAGRAQVPDRLQHRQERRARRIEAQQRALADRPQDPHDVLVAVRGLTLVPGVGIVGDARRGELQRIGHPGPGLADIHGPRPYLRRVT